MSNFTYNSLLRANCIITFQLRHGWYGRPARSSADPLDGLHTRYTHLVLPMKYDRQTHCSRSGVGLAASSRNFPNLSLTPTLGLTVNQSLQVDPYPAYIYIYIYRYATPVSMRINRTREMRSWACCFTSYWISPNTPCISIVPFNRHGEYDDIVSINWKICTSATAFPSNCT